MRACAHAVYYGLSQQESRRGLMKMYSLPEQPTAFLAAWQLPSASAELPDELPASWPPSQPLSLQASPAASITQVLIQTEDHFSCKAGHNALSYNAGVLMCAFRPGYLMSHIWP